MSRVRKVGMGVLASLMVVTMSATSAAARNPVPVCITLGPFDKAGECLAAMKANHTFDNTCHVSNGKWWYTGSAWR